MRTRLLRGREAVTVQLVYPSALEEYRQVLDVLGGCVPVAGNGGAASVPQWLEAGDAAYVVTTAQQRQLWGLPDLAVSGGAVPVDEESALELLHDAAVNPDKAVELFPAGSLFPLRRAPKSSLVYAAAAAATSGRGRHVQRVDQVSKLHGRLGRLGRGRRSGRHSQPSGANEAERGQDLEATLNEGRGLSPGDRGRRPPAPSGCRLFSSGTVVSSLNRLPLNQSAV